MKSAYPLQWPTGQPRWSSFRKVATFKVTEARAVEHLHEQLDAMRATNVVVSTNRQAYSRSSANPEDPGAAVYFVRKGQEICVACDKWIRLEHNIRAIGLTIEAMRGIDRWGTEDMVDAAFTGYAALPSSVILTPYTVRPWHEVLEVSPTASIETIRAAHKSHLMKAHPDRGGSTAAFEEVQRAFKEAVELHR